MTTFCIFCPELPERAAAAQAHFEKIGLNARFVYGIHGQTYGVQTSHTYDVDRANGHTIGYRHTGMNLSHYICWNICAQYPDETFLILEDDAQFEPDWKARINQVVLDAPENWDMIYVGSCNCLDKPKTHIKGELFRVEHPQCTHAYLITKHCAKILLETQRKCFAPIDLSLILKSLPSLNHFTVLPRIASQRNQEILP